MTVPIKRIRYTAPYDSTQTTFDALGAPDNKPPIILWRSPHKEEIKSDLLLGKTFRNKKYKHQQYICDGVDWVSNKKPSVVKSGLAVIDTRDIEFYLFTEQFYNTGEKIEWLRHNLPDLKEIILPIVGCQLHGDIDVSFIMNDGTEYTVPYNY